MLDRLSPVWRATVILATEDAVLIDRLKKAQPEFAVAMIEKEAWPKDLLDEAERLDARLLALDGMDGRELRQVAEDLLSLSDKVQREFDRDARRHQKDLIRQGIG